MNPPEQVQPDIDSPSDQFLRNAKLGRNRWWIWTLGIVAILVIWFGVAAIPDIAACQFVRNAELVDFTCEDSKVEGASTLPAFVLGAYGFVIAMIGIWLVVKLVHRKPLTKVVTARRSFDYNRALFAMLVGLVIIATPVLMVALVSPENIEFRSPDPWEYTVFFMFAIVLITIQAGFEEVFFRGYLLQWASLLSRNKIALTISTAIIFTLPHLANPEPWEYGVIPYVASLFAMGIFFGLVTVLDGGIELAVGVHVINNLFIALVANTSVAAFQTPSLFIRNIDEYRLFPDTIVLCLTFALILAILNLKYKWFSYRQLGSILKRQQG